MQTRKFGFRSLALLSAMVFGFAACDDTNTVGTPAVTTISVSPSGPIDLEVGDQIQIVASATNGTGAISFSSSNTAVATVDATSGVVTAVAPGNASISASVGSNAGGTVQQAVLVRVSAAGGGPIGGDSAQVNIVSITDAAGNQQDASDLAGTFYVRLDYERGNADSIRVTLAPRGGSAETGDPYCVQDFDAVAAKIAERGLSLSAAAVEFICPFNTLQLDADGNVVFPNGDYDIVAELFRGDNVVANARRNVTLDNNDTFVVTVETGANAIGEDGLRWDDGNVEVTASPAIFSSAEIAEVRFSTNGKTIVDNDPSDGFSAIFVESETPASRSLADLTDPTFDVVITSVTTAGAVGPAVTRPVPALRYDNEAPDDAGVVVTPTDFVGSDYEFAATAVDEDDFEDSDDGVGNEVVRAFVVDDFTDYPAGTTDRADLAEIMAGREVTGGADFEDAEDAEVVLLLCDELENCVVLGGFAFTVDFSDPTIEEVTVDGEEVESGDSLVNPVGPIVLTVEDDNAGFGAQALLVSATRLGENGRTECLIFDVNGNVTGSNATSACRNAPYATDLDVDFDATPGYYTYTMVAVDQGGNQSEPFTLRVLVDTDVPVVSSINFPVNIEGGESVQYVAKLTDNLDLNSYQFEIEFGDNEPGAVGLGRLPLSNFVTIDNTFGAPLTQEESVTYTQNLFIRGIEISDGAGAATGDVASPDFVFFTAVDQAQNSFALDQAFSDADYANFESVTVDNFTVQAPAAGDVEEGTFTFRVRATYNAANVTAAPFEVVYFYSRTEVAPGVFSYTLLGTDTSASRTVTPAESRFDYSVTANTDVMGGVGTDYDIFAVGVDEDGDGRTTNFVTVDVVEP